MEQRANHRGICAWRKRDPQLLHVYRYDPTLYHAAYRFFGNWHDAIEAAGVHRRQRGWSKQRVVDAIRAYHTHGVPIDAIAKTDTALQAAAHRHFGRWSSALVAAGLPVKLRRTWTAARVIETIVSLHRQGFPLVQAERADRSLGYAARRFFGSWPKAVKAAGIPDGWQHKWNRQRVIEALQACARAAGHVRCNRDVPNPVRMMAFYFFGTWHRALLAAELVPSDSQPTPRRKRTKAQILAEIRRQSVPGLPMKITGNLAFATAARKHFGSWHKALLAAGVDPVPWRLWSHQRVLEEIRAWHNRGVRLKDDRLACVRLHAAARARFGGWRKALIAAGLRRAGEYGKWERKWTKQRIIELIQDRHVSGLSLWRSTIPTSRGRLNDTSVLRAAIRAAGLPAKENRRPRQWSRQTVIEWIRLHRDRGVAMNRLGRLDSGLAAAGRKHFGTWPAALRAAGIRETVP